MNRRGFLGAILATVAAPAIVRASSLMPICGQVFRDEIVWLPDHILWGDGFHDDTAALQAYVNGRDVAWRDGRKVDAITSGTYVVSKTITLPHNGTFSISGAAFHGRIAQENPMFYIPPLPVNSPATFPLFEHNYLHVEPRSI